MTDGSPRVPKAALNTGPVVGLREEGAERYEDALRAILAVRLNTSPDVTLERSLDKARLEMRRIAKEALRV